MSGGVNSGAGAGVAQFDLTVYDSAAIVNSFTKIYDKTPSTPFKLYNDTIYYGVFSSFMNRINQPNLSGSACGFQAEAIRILNSTSVRNSLDNDVVFPLPKDTVYALALDSLVCAAFTLSAPEGFEEYIWEDGSTSKNRDIITPGIYWVLSKDFCNRKIDTFIISGMNFIPPVINVDERILGTTVFYSSYQWILNGSIIPGATDSIYIVSKNGDYQVIVSNKEGCRDTSEVYAVTNAGEPIHIQDINALAGQVYVFPNPAKDIIRIVAPIGVSIEVYSIEGRLIQQAESTKQINVAELSSGLYFLKIYDLKGRLLKSEKIVK